MYSSDSVLIVSGEARHCDQLAVAISHLGMRPVCCATGGEATELICQQLYCMIFCDERLADGDFRGVVQEASRSKDKPPVIVVSERGDRFAYLNAMRAGTFDYVLFPPGVGEIDRIVHAATQESKQRGRLTRATA
jgi:DNA-binding NtrC family response regulator